jgi:hypothetical protein
MVNTVGPSTAAAPDTTPVAGSSVSPGCSAPPVIENVTAPVALLTCTGALYGRFRIASGKLIEVKVIAPVAP